MVEIVKQGLVNDGRQRRADASRLHALLHDDHLACLLDTLADGFHIKRLQADQINHLKYEREFTDQSARSQRANKDLIVPHESERKSNISSLNISSFI